MNGPNPGGWQASLRGMAATAVLVAMGFYIAVALILSILKWLILIGVIIAIAYGVVTFERYRRTRW